MFTLVPHGSSGTAIKAGDNERYLFVTINGAGVPDSSPTFTSINASGQSVVNITVCIVCKYKLYYNYFAQ